jgi:uncharacterized protein (TIGR00730 family)
MKGTMKPLPTMRAYRNPAFMNSPAARELRILSEFLEPASRFRRQEIRNTVVVFGSARIPSMQAAKKRLAEVQSKISKEKRRGKGLEAKLERAIHLLEMSRYYEDAAQLTSMLARWSASLRKERQFVICSGGGPGIMEAANKGAAAAGEPSMGLNISLPFEQKSNKYVSTDLSFEFHYFFMRKFWFVYLAKALVMFPGGFGTFDELFEVLTLIQTKKVKKTMPILLYGRSYWEEVINFEAMVKHNVITKQDLDLFRFAESPEEAFSFLKKGLTQVYKSHDSRMVPRRG